MFSKDTKQSQFHLGTKWWIYCHRSRTSSQVQYLFVPDITKILCCISQKWRIKFYSPLATTSTFSSAALLTLYVNRTIVLHGNHYEERWHWQQAWTRYKCRKKIYIDLCKSQCTEKSRHVSGTFSKLLYEIHTSVQEITNCYGCELHYQSNTLSSELHQKLTKLVSPGW